MKLEITEIPSETTINPKVIGVTFKIKSFSEIRETLETFMKRYKFTRASFRLDGIIEEEVDYKLKEITVKTEGDSK